MIIYEPEKRLQFEKPTFEHLGKRKRYVRKTSMILWQQEKRLQLFLNTKNVN